MGDQSQREKKIDFFSSFENIWKPSCTSKLSHFLSQSKESHQPEPFSGIHACEKHLTSTGTGIGKEWFTAFPVPIEWLTGQQQDSSWWSWTCDHLETSCKVLQDSLEVSLAWGWNLFFRQRYKRPTSFLAYHITPNTFPPTTPTLFGRKINWESSFPDFQRKVIVATLVLFCL